jgi:glycopeptide antibiotics resistance protein
VQDRSTSEAERACEARALEHASALALVASLAAAVVATLAPFQLAIPAASRVDVSLRLSDVLLNLALLAPFGFVLGMRTRRSGYERVSPAVRAFALGAALSAVLELAQLFVPVRCPSPIDVLANALGCSVGCVLHARLGLRAERMLLGFLRSPSAAGVALLALALGALALAPLDTRLTRATFHWTLGTVPMGHGPQAIVIGLIASLGLAAWLGFALRLRASSALTATACALPIVAAIEVCRGYSVHSAASLVTLLLAAVCSLVSAHAAGRFSQVGRLAATQSAARRIWV